MRRRISSGDGRSTSAMKCARVSTTVFNTEPEVFGAAFSETNPISNNNALGSSFSQHDVRAEVLPGVEGAALR